MSARDSAYLVPVGLRGGNKKAPQRKGTRGRRGGLPGVDEWRGRMRVRFANLWPKTGDANTTRRGDMQSGGAGALCKRSSATNSLSAPAYRSPGASTTGVSFFIYLASEEGSPCNARQPNVRPDIGWALSRRSRQHRSDWETYLRAVINGGSARMRDERNGRILREFACI